MTTNIHNFPGTGVFTESYGNEFHYVNGELHRDGDLPAVIGKDGTLQWRSHGKLHRDYKPDGTIDPAFTTPGFYGIREYYRNGVQGFWQGHTLWV